MDLRREKLLDQVQSLSRQSLPAPELAARLVLLHLATRHGVYWLSGPRERHVTGGETQLLDILKSLAMDIPKRREQQLSGLSDLPSLWRAFFFRGVVLDSHEGQLGWMNGRYPIEARFDIPKPEEMLAAQCEGRRFVTLFNQPDQQFVPYGRHADACDFMLHDFEHAHKFFADQDSHRGQVRFFRALRNSLDQLNLWNADARFQADLDYIMSDMNSHPVHLMKYLKAVVLNAEIRRTANDHPPLDDFWLEYFSGWRMTGETLKAALSLNQPAEESTRERQQMAEFFMTENSACVEA